MSREFTSLENEIRIMEKEMAHRRKFIEAYRSVFPIGNEIAQRWIRGKKGREAGTDLAYGVITVDCLCIDLYLVGSDDLLRDVEPMMDVLIDDPLFDYQGQSEYAEVGWKGWDFHYTGTTLESRWGSDQNAPIKVKVRAWFENSQSCKVVETGEFKPVIKIMCAGGSGGGGNE